MPTPDIVSLEKKTGSTTASGVSAGGYSYVTVTLASNLIIIGVPKVSTTTTDARVEVVNGGKNTFTVKAYNDGASAQDVAISYEVYVMKEV